MMTQAEMTEMIDFAEFIALRRGEEPLQLCAENYVRVITPYITALDVSDGLVTLGLDPSIEPDANQFLTALQERYGEVEMNVAINAILVNAAVQAQTIKNLLGGLFN